jgi:hypothetical protein
MAPGQISPPWITCIGLSKDAICTRLIRNYDIGRQSGAESAFDARKRRSAD